MPVSTPQSAVTDSSPARGAFGRVVRPSLFLSYNAAIYSAVVTSTTVLAMVLNTL